MTDAALPSEDAVRIENAEGASPFVLVCEHASNAFPARWGTLGLDDAARAAHIAWDPGALGLARGLSSRLGAPLVHATASRLIYDLNRPPHAPGAMAAESEIFRIPGNADLGAADRQARTTALYLPFHAAVAAVIAQRLARGDRPILITVHSFTPVWFGQPRGVEFGIIHDRDAGFALRLLDEARIHTRMRCELNSPYSATDGVTHTLRLHATPYSLPHAMLELRNDLIATPQAQEAMAAQIASALTAARLPQRVRSEAMEA